MTRIQLAAIAPQAHRIEYQQKDFTSGSKRNFWEHCSPATSRTPGKMGGRSVSKRYGGEYRMKTKPSDGTLSVSNSHSLLLTAFCSVVWFR